MSTSVNEVITWRMHGHELKVAPRFSVTVYRMRQGEIGLFNSTSQTRYVTCSSVDTRIIGI